MILGKSQSGLLLRGSPLYPHPFSCKSSPPLLLLQWIAPLSLKSWGARTPGSRSVLFLSFVPVSLMHPRRRRFFPPGVPGRPPTPFPPDTWRFEQSTRTLVLRRCDTAGFLRWNLGPSAGTMTLLVAFVRMRLSSCRVAFWRKADEPAFLPRASAVLQHAPGSPSKRSHKGFPQPHPDLHVSSLAPFFNDFPKKTSLRLIASPPLQKAPM